jgi:hypothetical protein
VPDNLRHRFNEDIGASDTCPVQREAVRVTEEAS